MTADYNTFRKKADFEAFEKSRPILQLLGPKRITFLILLSKSRYQGTYKNCQTILEYIWTRMAHLYYYTVIIYLKYGRSFRRRLPVPWLLQNTCCRECACSLAWAFPRRYTAHQCYLKFIDNLLIMVINSNLHNHDIHFIDVTGDNHYKFHIKRFDTLGRI